MLVLLSFRSVAEYSIMRELGKSCLLRRFSEAGRRRSSKEDAVLTMGDGRSIR